MGVKDKGRSGWVWEAEGLQRVLEGAELRGAGMTGIILQGAVSTVSTISDRPSPTASHLDPASLKGRPILQCNLAACPPSLRPSVPPSARSDPGPGSGRGSGSGCLER